MQDESHWVYQNRKHIHWSLNHINWSLNGCQWDISWWQFDISESEISAECHYAIRRILVIVSGILADANGISAEYQWNWWNISNVVANTTSVVIKIVGFFFTERNYLCTKAHWKVTHNIRKVFAFFRKSYAFTSEINAFICESNLFIQGKKCYLPKHF